MKTILTSAVFLGLIFLGIIGCVSNMNSLNTTTVENNAPETVAADDNGNSERKPVIVELFTSEGCSSCPPADGNLKLLVETQPIAGAEVIALSEHVDYWNRLGWADPFSAAQFSARQSEYSDFFRQNGEVYTPQMIVDGTRQFVGGNMREALKQIGEAAKDAKGTVNIEVVENVKNQVALKVDVSKLPEISKNDRAIVLLAVTENNLISNVARGENSGQKLTHAAVTRHLQNVGEVATGADKTLTANVTLDKSWKPENLSIIAFVQETGSRKILGAGKIGLQK